MPHRTHANMYKNRSLLLEILENIFVFYCFVHLRKIFLIDLQIAQNVEAWGEAAGDGDVHDVADLEEAGVSLSISIK